MTHHCNHISEVKKIMENAFNCIDKESKEEEVERPSDGGLLVRAFIPIANFHDTFKLEEIIEIYEKWMNESRDILVEAESKIKSCSCLWEQKELKDRAKEESESLKEEIIDLKNQIQNYLNVISGLEKEKKWLDDHVSLLEESKVDRDKQLSELKGVGSENKYQLEKKDEQLNRLNKNLSDLQVQINDKKIEILNKTNESKELNSQITKLQSDLEKSQSKVSAKNKELKTRDDLISKLEKESNNKQFQLDNLNKEKNSLNQQVKELQDSKSVQGNKLERYASERSNLEAKVHEKEKIVLTREKELISERNEKEKLNSLVTELKGMASLKDKELQVKNNSISELNKELNDKSNEINNKKNQLDNLTREKEELLEKTDHLSGQLEKARQDTVKLQKDLSEYQRSIILIGNTGSGKSTLANMLLNKNGNFEEIFKANEGSTSVTKEVQVEEFTTLENNGGMKYRIIDIIGLNDTKLSQEEVIKEVKESTFKGNYNLNQVLFVFNGRLDDGEKKLFKLLKKEIFSEDIVKYTTLVKTHFDNGFDNEQKCKDDIKSLLDPEKVDEEGIEIIESCNKRVIHVSNPLMPIIEERDDEEEIEDKKTQVRLSKKKWTKSREILMKHLLTVCQENHKEQEQASQQELVAQIEQK